MRLWGGLILATQEHGNKISLKQPDVYRILCVGESTTAIGGRVSYPAQLEEILNRRSAVMKFRVINQGRVATNTVAIANSLEAYLDAYDPQMVIVMMGINDGGILNIPGHSMAFRRPPFFDPHTLKIYKLARLLWASLKARFSTGESLVPLPAGKDFLEQGLIYHYQWGDYARASELFHRALEEDPSKERIYLELARLDKHFGRYEQSEVFVRKVLEMNPKSAEAYGLLGRIYAGKKEFETAKVLLRKAIALDPKKYFFYSELGEVCLLHGDFASARDSFEKALELNRDSGRACKGLSLAYLGLGMLDLARSYDQKAEELMVGLYRPVTRSNYYKIKTLLDERGVKFVCVQYPMRALSALRNMLAPMEGVIFVDNEKVFKEAVQRDGYAAYFMDRFAVDFGHCTPDGNRLLAENIADVILKEVFEK